MLISYGMTEKAKKLAIMVKFRNIIKLTVYNLIMKHILRKNNVVTQEFSNRINIKMIISLFQTIKRIFSDVE